MTTMMLRVVREITEAVLLALAVFVLLQATVQNFKVHGSSMVPTLEGGQYLLVNRLVYLRVDMERLSRVVPFWKVTNEDSHFSLYSPRRGDVIVFKAPREPDNDFVKRVLGLPGEIVEVKNGRVFINGVLIDEPYLRDRDTRSAAPVKLGADEYYVLGDNRRQSNDSRAWGPVPEGYIEGKVWVVYWPFSGAQIMNVALPEVVPVSAVALR